MPKSKKPSKKKKVSEKRLPEVEIYTPSSGIDILREEVGLGVYPENNMLRIRKNGMKGVRK